MCLAYPQYRCSRRWSVCSCPQDRWRRSGRRWRRQRYRWSLAGQREGSSGHVTSADECRSVLKRDKDTQKVQKNGNCNQTAQNTRTFSVEIPFSSNKQIINTLANGDRWKMSVYLPVSAGVCVRSCPGKDKTKFNGCFLFPNQNVNELKKWKTHTRLKFSLNAVK